MFDLSILETVLAILVAWFGTARLTRIITHDDYPPAAWLRSRWIALTWDRKNDSEGDWGKLATCIWCAQPYVVAICMVWAYFTDFHWTWWAFWAWMALSQAGSTLLAYDEPAE